MINIVPLVQIQNHKKSQSKVLGATPVCWMDLSTILCMHPHY